VQHAHPANAGMNGADAKIRAFLAAGIVRRWETERNSATGSPRNSIMIASPAAASWTSFDVWI
jgi:hypothetical protein